MDIFRGTFLKDINFRTIRESLVNLAATGAFVFVPAGFHPELPADIDNAMHRAWKVPFRSMASHSTFPSNITLQCGGFDPKTGERYPSNDSVIRADYNFSDGKKITVLTDLKEHPGLCGNGSVIPLALGCSGETLTPNMIRQRLSLPSDSVSDDQAIDIFNSTKVCGPSL